MNYTGNISTIVKWISMIIAGYAVGIFISEGLNLPINESQLSELIAAIIFLILGYIDSKYPNTFTFLQDDSSSDSHEYPGEEQ